MSSYTWTKKDGLKEKKPKSILWHLILLVRFIKGKMLCRHFSMGSVYCYDCLVLCRRDNRCEVVKNGGWNFEKA